MENRMIVFALQEMEEVGWVTISKLVAHFSEISHVIHASPLELEQLGIRKKQVQTILKHLNEAFVQERLTAYYRQNIDILTLYDKEYPTSLRHSFEAPFVLYYKGNLALLQNHLFAIVGTRVPTAYGKSTAIQFGEGIAKAGLTVVSGMARGIDSCAHIGAIKHKGSTIAILGCGIDIIYPPENGGLYRDIARKGLILSEFPLGTPAQPGLFPMRNRIIAGLCLGILIVEAALNSGSFITASIALNEGRDIFVIPGQLNSPKSQGVFPLFSDGAKMVFTVKDILDEYEHILHLKKAEIALAKGAQTQVELNADEQEIYNFLVTEPATFDSILEGTQTNFGHLHSILLSLVMKKAINQLPGSIYSIR